MICPECKEQGKKSRVYEGVSNTTLAWCGPFYDEEGQQHHHDSNTITSSYRCSEGHEWTVESQPGSCWCGWKADEK